MRIHRHRRRVLLGAGLIVAGLAATAAFAAGNAGSLDPSFAGTGYTTTSFGPTDSFAQGVTNYDGGKSVVVGGHFDGVQGDFAIARYNKDGSLDTSFGTGGKVTTDFFGFDDLATSVTTQGDKIVVAGYAQPDLATYEFALARYNKNGSLDTSFGSGGKVVTSFGTLQDIADAVAVKGNKIVAAGASKSLVTGNDFALARYNKDGSLDSSFGTGGKVTTDFNGGFDSANGVAYVGDDIVAAGYVDGLTPMSDYGLARYNKDGSLDSRFGTGGKVRTDFFGGEDAGHAIDVKGDDVVVVGSAQNGADSNDFAAALYDRRGRLDPEFGTGGKATMNIGADDVAFGGGFGPHETVVAAGDNYTGTDQFAVARWTEKGQPDPSFGTGGFTTTAIGAFSAAYAMTLGPEQKIVAAGESDGNFAVARYLNK